jgi:hypothetical protein
LCGPQGPINGGEFKWLSETFISNVIAPNIKKLMGPNIASTLGKTLLYAAINKVSNVDNTFDLLPTNLRSRIIQSIMSEGGFDIESSIPTLIERRTIILTGYGGSLNFTEAGQITEDSNSGSFCLMSEMMALNVNVLQLQRRQEEMITETQRSFRDLQEFMQKNIQRMNSSIKRIALQPVVRPRNEEARERARALLVKCPRDLFVLWQEYEHGIDGSKPARLFTSKERGQCKYTFSLRMNFWSIVEEMIRRGHTSDSALDKVYSVYGRAESTTCILRAIRKDKNAGGHSNLL